MARSQVITFQGKKYRNTGEKIGRKGVKVEERKKMVRSAIDDGKLVPVVSRMKKAPSVKEHRHCVEWASGRKPKGYKAKETMALAKKTGGCECKKRGPKIMSKL